MTLAYYGKSRRRQSLLTALTLFAVVAGVMFAGGLGGVFPAARIVAVSDTTIAAPLPTITKVAATGLTNPDGNGDGYFDLTVWNNASDAIVRTVTFHDAGALIVSVNGANCAGAIIPGSSADGLTCTVLADATNTIRVRKLYATASYPGDPQQCRSGTMQNIATLTLRGSTEVISTSATATVIMPAYGLDGGSPACAAATRTLRIQKVSTSLNHDNATFTGSVLPGGTDTAFSVSLNTGAQNQVSLPQSLTVSTAAQTITEDTPPAGWTLNGYYVAADTGQSCTGAETPYAAGSSATVPEGTGNYLVCIKNTPRFLSVCKKLESNGDAITRSGDFKFDVNLGGTHSTVTLTATEGAANVCQSLIPIPGGPTTDVTVTELSDRPSGWLGDAPGYPKNNFDFGGAVAHPGTAYQSPTLIFFNREALPLSDPTVSKVKDSLGVTGGFAYWDITVNNQANTANSQTVFITDAATYVAAVSGGSCPSAAANTTDMTAGISCSVDAGAILTVRVRKAVPAATCLPQTINNSATVKLGDVAGKLLGSVGGTTGANGTEYTIAADTTKCGQPSISKTSVTGGVGALSVNDPADVQWTVSVVNPESLPGADQTVHIKDSNVVVTANPALAGGATCPAGGANNTNPNFQTQLNTASGVECFMPAGSQTQSSITFTVKPATTPVRTCADQVFNNTASMQVGTQPATNAQGPAITLTGDNSLCPGTIVIQKNYLPAGVTPVEPAFFIGTDTAVLGSNTTTAGDHSVSETPPTGWKFVSVEASAGCDGGVALLKADTALLRAFEALTGTNEIAVFVTPGLTCTVTFTNERLTGTVIVKKVKDPTAGVPAADSSLFKGTVGGVAWSQITFGGTAPSISVPPGDQPFVETGTENGWTPVGFTTTANGTADTVCSTDKAAYNGKTVPVVAGQTTVVCVMNTKTALVTLPTVKKVKVDATHYTITVTNAGGTPITNISVTDTFAQGGTTQTIDVVTWNPNDGLCSFGPNKLSFACTGLTVPAEGNLVITVLMTPYTNAQVCSDQIVTNKVEATFNGSAITVTPGSSNVATHAFPTTRTDCNNGTIAVKKVRDQGASSFADGSLFGGTIDGSSWGNPITFDGVTPPQSVGPGNHTVTETSAGGWILVGYQVFTNSSTTASCPTDSRGYSQSYTNGVTAPVATGQLTLVCVMNTKAAPPPPPLCTFCNPLILSTPTPTPTNPPTVPTNTPAATSTPKTTDQPVITKPTETVNAVAGEKTPGPGAKSTPIAPSTGTGISGAAASFNGLLALIGIAILGAGMALMAAGRRKTRD